MHHKVIVQSQGKKLKNYCDLFKQLEDATGIADPQRLADQMKSSEDQLFSIFKHTSQLEKEIERETAHMHRLKDEIRQLLPRGDGRKGGARHLVEQLNDKLRDTKAKTTKYLESARGASRELHSLDRPVARLLTAASLLDLGDAETLDSRSSALDHRLAKETLDSKTARRGSAELSKRAKSGSSISSKDDVRDFLLLNEATSNPSFRASTMMEQLGMIEMRVRAFLITSDGGPNGLKRRLKNQGGERARVSSLESSQTKQLNSALTSDAIFTDAFETGVSRGGDCDADFIPLSLKQTRGTVDRYFSKQRDSSCSEKALSKRSGATKEP
eukprot:g1593.t1